MSVDPAALAATIALDWSQERRLIEHATPREPPRRRVLAPSTFADEDVLLTIAPTVYDEVLAHVEAPDHGGMICCPLPDHDDQTPSFRVYGDPDEGWYCYGCNRGGTIYDFGAALWGLPTRGSAFVELRQRLAEALLGATR